jgi:diacylglycerol kinase family enzyme
VIDAVADRWTRRPQWCNVCESIVYGIRSYVVKCDICGMYAHAQCAATTMRYKGVPLDASGGTAVGSGPRTALDSAADATGEHDGNRWEERGDSATLSAAVCKAPAVAAPASGVLAVAPPPSHMWVKGNIDPMDTCAVCGLFCGSLLALSGMKCAWCHLRVHENCYNQAIAASRKHHHHHHYSTRLSTTTSRFQQHSQLEQQRAALLRRCDFGRHANLVMPPTCVILREASTSTRNFSTTSQRALSSVRSAAQIAVHKMSNLRLRRSLPTPDNSGRLAAAGSSGGSDADSMSMVASGNGPASSSSFVDAHHLPLEPISQNGHGTYSDDGYVTARHLDSDMPFDIITPQQDESRTPLLVFINSRSGGQMGLHVLRQLRAWLNPLQVYDLSHQSPVEPLRAFLHVPRLRVLVCGGDGTVGWVLSSLDELGYARQPPIAVLPLGTGNDLARVLGWGSGFSARSMSDVLAEVEAAHVSLLDRWRVDIDGKKRAVLNNYLGVGVDAQVALEFHEQRERSPGLFMSQFVNKLWYSQFGAKNFLVRTCAGLPSKLELVCDGQIIELPEGTEGVIVLNINSYGGGSTLWHDGDDSEEEDDGEEEDDEEDDEDEDSGNETEDGSMSDSNNSYGSDSSSSRRRHQRIHHRQHRQTHHPSRQEDTDDDERDSSSSSSYSDQRRSVPPPIQLLGPSSPHDGLLDVVAVYGTLHLGQMQVGLSKAVRLCQAKSISIRLKETLPMQIDGEPWLQTPTDVEVSFQQQAFMLSRTVQERDVVTKKVGEVLDWAEHSHVISSRQRDVLLAEIARRVADGASSSATGSGLTASASSSALAGRQFLGNGAMRRDLSNSFLLSTDGI